MSKLSAKWQDLPRYQRELVVSTLAAAYDSNIAAATHYRSIGLGDLAERMESNAGAYDSALDDLGVQMMMESQSVGEPNKTGRFDV